MAAEFDMTTLYDARYDAMRRVSSMPAIVNTERVYANDDESDDDAFHRRANSNGCGPTSPTAVSVINRLWKVINGRPVQLWPKLVVQDMNNRLFCGIYFYPLTQFEDGTDFPSVQPWEWHSSITTAYYVDDLMWRTIDPLSVLRAWRRLNMEIRLTAKLQVIWDLIFPHERTVISFERGPYGGMSSWGFAVPPSSMLGNALEILQKTSEHVVVYEYAGRLKLRRRRPLHVSWR